MYVDHYLTTPGISGAAPMLNVFQGRNFDPGMRRPYVPDSGRYANVPCVTVNTGRTELVKGQRVQVRQQTPLRDLILNGVIPPVFNATALRKEEWIELDKVVLKAARYPLKFWGDLMAAVPYGGFNGMNKMMLEHETMSDPGVALQDMDGLSEGQGDAPLFQLEGVPLVITHSDFNAAARKLAISRNTGTPLDTTMGEAAGRRIGEMVEKVSIGIKTGITYGGTFTQYGGYSRNSTVYGMTNFTPRLTKINITAPTSGSWVPTTLLNEVLAAIRQVKANKFFGPYRMYTTPDWDPYLDADYFYALTSGAVAPTKTLRTRLKEIVDISDVLPLQMWFPNTTDANSHNITTGTYGPGGDVDATLKTFSFALLQLTPDVVQAVNGMDITTVQWETVGGMRVNFKVMCIQVTRFRADYYGNVGYIHCTTS